MQNTISTKSAPISSESDAKSRLIHAKAEKAEIELGIAKGEIVKVSQVKELWLNALLIFRSEYRALKIDKNDAVGLIYLSTTYTNHTTTTTLRYTI